MRKKSPKYYFLLATVLIVLVLGAVAFLLPESINAADDIYGVNYGAATGLSGEDIRITVIKVIRAILGTLGVIALVIILYAGFLWMTSAGSEEKIAKAKKIILNAVIGLVIIMMAFAIVQYIFKVLSGEGNGGGGGGFCNIGECSGCLRCVDGQNYRYDVSCDPSCNNGGGGADSFKIEEVQTAHGAVLATSPFKNPQKSNVFWCSKVQTVFNHNIDNNTVTGAFSSPAVTTDKLRIAALTNPESVADGSWNTFGNVLVFTPKNNSYDNRKTTHASHLPTVLKDLSKRNLSQCANVADCNSSPPPDFTWNFYVGEEGDSVNPTIVRTYPRKDIPYDANVSRDPIIEVYFSENIDATSLFGGTGNSTPSPAHFTLEELDKNGNPVGTVDNNIFSANMDGQGFRVNLISPNLLKSFTTYRATVKDISDLCGNKMDPASFSWQFTTNDKAPGVENFYPTGDSNCPNIRPAITFNTTMYEQEIQFTISEYVVVNNQNQIVQQFNYILAPHQTMANNSAGVFQVTDAGDPSDPNYNINEHFRSYEFIPSGDLKDNSKYHISVVTDKILDANRTVLTKSWDFGVSDLSRCVCSPYISGLSKENGPVGECLTISGQCFKGTAANPATVAEIKFGSKTAFIPNTADYGDNYIATTVPDGLSAGDRPKVVMSIKYQGANQNILPSNQKDFYILSGKAEGPCLWSVRPNSGDRGSRVELSGIRFGAFGTIHEAHFTPFATAVYQIPNTADWTDTLIKNIIVPATALDGDVKLKNDKGESNGVPFNVNFCGDNSLDPGEECDGANLNGKTCADMGFVGGDLTCDSSCKFKKDKCSNAPGIVINGVCALVCLGGSNDGKSCTSDTDCPSGFCQIKNDGLPSPSPRPNASNVCINTAISALFTTDIQLTTINTTNIYLQKCNTNNCQDDNSDPANPKPGVNPTRITASVVAAGNRSFVLTPTSNLDTSTTYQATIKKDIKNTSGVNMPNDYIWRFQTKSSGTLCPIDKVYVEPRDITVNGNIATPYNAKAIAPFISTNCSLINANAYNWQWKVEDNNNPTIGVSISGGGPSVTATSGTKSGTVYVSAETENKKDQGKLNVFVDTCSSDIDCAVNPNCVSTCDIPTKRCKPVVKSLNPSSGPNGRWVTITGCYFKSNRGSGKVEVGPDSVNIYPCSERWSDTEIIISIPSSLVSAPVDLPVIVTDQYGLSSNKNIKFKYIEDCILGVSAPAGGLPGLCSLNPNMGKWGDAISLAGEKLGTTQKLVKFNGSSGAIDGAINNWSNTGISAKVPPNTITGPVYVEIDGCPSNSLNFNLATGGAGSDCDKNKTTATCDADNNLCWSGLICDRVSCKCQAPPKASIISSSLSPVATNACRNSIVQATFDQKMDQATINGNTVLVFNKSADDVGKKCYDETEIALGPDNQKMGLLSVVFEKIKNFFRPSKAKAAGGDWYCPVSGNLSSFEVAKGGEGCTNDDGCTVIRFTPDRGLFAGNTKYLVYYLGGANGLKTSFGAEINTNASSKKYKDIWSQSFTTKNEICKIAKVSVNIEYKGVQKEKVSRDYFTCADRDICPDDVDASAAGNQHKYTAIALDKDNQRLSAAYQWKQNTNEFLIINSANQQVTNITSQKKSGETTVSATASDPDPAVGLATGSVIVTNFICENPWPTFSQGFPYSDKANNCNVSGSTADCYDMTFTTFYCRDYGQMNKFCKDGVNAAKACINDTGCPSSKCLEPTADDLPALNIPGKIKGREKGYCVGGDRNGAECSTDTTCAPTGHCYNSVKEFLFLIENDNKKRCSASNIDCSTETCPVGETCDTLNDSIGIRIYNNGEHLSPSAWAQKYENKPASGTTGKIDGYESMAAGRTSYVNMAVDQDPAGTHNIFTNIFLVSHTDNPKITTTETYNQITQNLVFNSNSITNNRICVGGTAPGTYCLKDSDCGAGGTCDAKKDKLARDVIRMGHLKQMIYFLDKYRGTCSKHVNLACVSDSDCPGTSTGETCNISHGSYPTLSAGTYKAGESVSIWDSWSNTFASLINSGSLRDPLNKAVDCPEGYNTECWSSLAKDFKCPAGSHMYHYQSINSGDSYKFYLNMEYSPSGWGVGSTTIGSEPCSPGTYNLLFQRK
ncbi:hypothetical protein GYA54_03810 [Candidatus Kuenenbacteria bacterium]|nr:hypothetical protein [Candidatus Kuenenbacteria bacterium]